MTKPLVLMPVAVPGKSEKWSLTIRVRPGDEIPIPAPRSAVQITKDAYPPTAARKAVPARIALIPSVRVRFTPILSASHPPGRPNSAIITVGRLNKNPACA